MNNLNCQIKNRQIFSKIQGKQKKGNLMFIFYKIDNGNKDDETNNNQIKSKGISLKNLADLDLK